MSEQNQYLLEMRGIKKSFSGITVLNNVNLTLRPGTVHALIGENGAGKSTLMKILSGIYQPDGGEIFIDGERQLQLNPKSAIEKGIAMIHQELSPIPNMTIAENIYLGREPGKGLVDYKKMNSDAERELRNLGLDYDPKKPIRLISVAGMQMVEIAKAISRDAKIIIMDEPTSSLTSQEVETLFEKIAELKKKNIGIIYITHKMDEIFRITDELSVLRDGNFISSGPASEYTMDRIITEMVGREISNIYPKTPVDAGDVVFKADHITIDGVFEDVSFEIKSGEIAGMSGLVGAGRTEVARAVFGLDALDSGEMYLNGEKLKVKHPSDAIKYGIAMASEDRKLEGLVLCRSLQENIMLPNLDMVNKNGLLSAKKEKDISEDMIKKLGVKAKSVNTLAVDLSGGNQQKIVLIKWLLKDIKLLILDEPTKGIDVGAKHEIYELMCDLARQGVAILMISSDLPEILGMSDKVLVMSGGRLVGELTREEASQETVMRHAISNVR